MMVLWGTACTTVGPDYARPPADVAKQWMEVDDPRFKAEPADHREWWTVFNDPVLDFLVDTAYKQNLTLRSAGIRILEARAQLGIAVGNQYPQTQQATARYARVTLSEELSLVGVTPSDTNFNLNLIGFDASWELDLWGRFRRGVEAGNADLGASMAHYDDILVSLVAEVAATYVQIRTFEERLKVARQNVKTQERSFQIASVRFRNGAVTEVDVQQARSNLRNTEALIPELEKGLRQAQNALSILLGMPPGDLKDVLGSPISIPTVPPDVAVGVPADLLRRRPDIQRAERLVAAQSARIGIAESDLYPRISIAGSFGWTANDITDLFTQASFAGFGGPSVIWPIFNYGRIKNNVRVQDARFQQLVVDYQNTVLKAAEEVENAMVAFLRTQEQVKFLADSAEAARRWVDLSLIQYREGLVDFTPVLVAQDFLAKQDDRLAQTTGNIVISLIAMYKGLGGGWEIRIGKDFVPVQTKQQMQDRTNWGDLLTSPEDLSPKPVGVIPAAPDW
jgi:NodT family efflux transporter outer membrane factor (OMF) lipoprotein